MIQQYPIRTDAYTEIVAPIAGNSLMILNSDGSPMIRSSDPSDDTHEYTMPDPYGLVGTRINLTGPGYACPFRYNAGDTVAYLKAVSGSGPAVVEFQP